MSSEPQLGLAFGEPTDPPETWRRWVYVWHASGRRYRWRLDTVREYGTELEEYRTSAPPTIRWELQYETDGTWRDVRSHRRRDELWCDVRDDALEMADSPPPNHDDRP